MGELELMIAVSSARRKGHGRATILTFLLYISRHIDSILTEYSASESNMEPESGGDATRKKRWKGMQLRVKIGGENEKSLKLFEGLGWIGRGVNHTCLFIDQHSVESVGILFSMYGSILFRDLEGVIPKLRPEPVTTAYPAKECY